MVANENGTQRDEILVIRCSQVLKKPGERVQFVLRNEDPEMHNIFGVTPGLVFPANTQAAGATNRVEFVAPTQPGTYEAVCQFHSPGMKQLITVQ